MPSSEKPRGAESSQPVGEDKRCTHAGTMMEGECECNPIALSQHGFGELVRERDEAKTTLTAAERRAEEMEAALREAEKLLRRLVGVNRQSRLSTAADDAADAFLDRLSNYPKATERQ